MKATLFLLVTVVSGCWCFYPKNPTIRIATRSAGKLVEEGGSYITDYTSNTGDVPKAQLYVADDPTFGCPGGEGLNTSALSPREPFVVLLSSASSYGSCSDFTKARSISRWGASGLIFQLDRKNGWLEPDNRPSRDYKLSSQITVVSVEIQTAIVEPLVHQSGITVSIIGHYSQFQNSQTFYFIVFAFCILMLLSCLWFVMSYIKRCHYNIQRRRRRIRNANETRRAVNRLPVKSFKSMKNAEDQTCAVCLEAFHNNDAIRILPCKHEFHKKCVDPWLKIKQNCPMCKASIKKDPSSSGTPLRESVAASSAAANEPDDFSIINLRHEEEDIGSPEPLGEVDTTSNTSNSASDTSEPASESPLLPVTEEPTVVVTAYSPQVEVRLESLLPGEIGDP